MKAWIGSPVHRQRHVKSTSSERDSSSDSEWTVKKEKQQRRTSSSINQEIPKSHYSAGRVIAFAAFCSSIAAVITALLAVYFFFYSSNSTLLDLYSDQLITTTSVVRTSRFRPPPTLSSSSSSSSSMKSNNSPPPQLGLQSFRMPSKFISLKHNDVVPPQNETKATTAEAAVVAVTTSEAIEDHNNNGGIQPHLVWLMSFPNSGTSFTIHMTREATNCTTATNYALEGEIRDKPSIPVFPGEEGSLGPWLELIPDRHTTVPKHLILTKTHCKGFCSGRYCGPEKTILTVRSFMLGCLSGTRAMQAKRGLEKKDVNYKPSLVKKAIHLFRHPLDNIVARFHLEYNVHKANGNHRYTHSFPKNATGFRGWCAMEDKNRGLLHTKLLDRHLRRQLRKIPCFNEFYRYLQWHNLAFSMAHEMNLPTMILHYHEYSTNFEKARDRVLSFLDLPRTGEGIEFHSGKVYRNYYTSRQKKAIRAFLEEFSSAETWEELKGYDFEIYD